MTILHEWGITAEELTGLLNENPSLQGMLLGYVAEFKLRQIVNLFPEVSFIKKFDDHDRKRKGCSEPRKLDRKVSSIKLSPIKGRKHYHEQTTQFYARI